MEVRQVALLVLIAGLAAACDAQLLFTSPGIVGADGYYYAVQVRQLLSGLPLAYPIHTPLVFHLLALFAYLWPLPIALKAGAVFSDALLVFGCGFLILTATRSSAGASVSAAIAAFSKSHWYFVAEFIKNAASLGCLLISCALLILAARANRGTRRWATFFAVCFALASISSHVSSWLAIPIIGLFSALHLLYGERLYSWRAVSVLLGCIWIATRLVGLSGTLAPGRLSNIVLTRPANPIHLDNPACVPELFSLLIFVPATVSLLARRSSQTSDLVAGVVTWWTLALTMNPFLDHVMLNLGAEGRIDHFAYLQVAMLAGLLLSRLRQDVVWQTGSFALCALLLGSSRFTSLPHGLNTQFINGQAELERGLRKHAPDIRPNWILVTNQADRYVAAWSLPNHAQIHPAPKPFWILLRDIDCTRGLNSRAIIVTETGDQDACSILLQSEKMQSLYLGMRPAEARYARARNLPLDEFLRRMPPFIN